nr:glycosyltransferase [Tahibacter harae]
MQGLSPRGYRFSLLTFERSAAAAADIAATRERLAAQGIDWHCVTAHRGWGALSSLRDLCAGLAVARRLQQTRPARLIHARSFIPALIAWRLARHGPPFLNDLRGFWIDEKVYRGRLRENGPAYRLAKQLEARVLHASDAIVSLSERGAQALQESAASRGQPLPPLVTIPTCVDTARFVPAARPQTQPRLFGYVGSLGAEYLPERIIGYFAAARRHFPGCRLKLISRSSAAPLRALAAQQGLPPDSIAIVALPPEQVPAEVARFDVAMSFIRPHFSKLASCPTKVGEYLAAGVPVVGNAGIGDMDALLGDGRVGFLLRDFDTGSLEDSFRHLRRLWGDAGLAARCRAAALAQFSLREGINRYDAIYRMLLARGGLP